MSERFLRKADIAAMLGTSPDVAVSILEKRGIAPIDLGVGRSRGLRWLESAVQTAMREMYAEAQPKPKAPIKPKPQYAAYGLADMKIKDLQAILTTGQHVQ